MAAGYGFTSCVTIDCPGNTFSRPVSSMAKSDMRQDCLGNYWCARCRKRGELIDWAGTHDWPAARVQGKEIYALVGSPADWYTSIVMASEDMVVALHETLIQQTRTLPPEDTGERVDRVKAWLEAFEDALAEY